MRQATSRARVHLAAMMILAVALAAGCGPSRLEVLENSVNAESADVRREAFYEMGKWDKAEGELVDLVELTLVGESDPQVRAQVANTLGRWGRAESVDELALCLEKDPDVHVRTECAWALGRIKTDESRAALARAMQSDPRTEVRVAAAKSLREFRQEAAAKALLPALSNQERDPAVRHYAAESLRYLTGVGYGDDAEAWEKYLAEAENPLAGYGHPSRRVEKAAEPPVSAEAQSKTREILGDLFPLERKEGPFD